MTGYDPDLALASRLRNLASNLEAFPHLDGYRDCGCLRCRARTYAATGYPTRTLSDGAGRSSDSTSSTERAATETGLFADLDYRYAAALDTLDRALADAEGAVNRVMAHASDDDVVLAGTGPCVVTTCDHLCNPRKKPDDRLRGGLCPACHQAWLRYQRRHTSHATRSAFLTWRARELSPEPRTQPPTLVTP
ncbi:MAG: hypothetical protein L0206_16840 [Actinobacteria bacterium]|nr:hypothetical protein [Actinomycetota bacterium]